MGINWKKFGGIALNAAALFVPAFGQVEGIAKLIKQGGGTMTGEQKEDEFVQRFKAMLNITEAAVGKELLDDDEFEKDLRLGAQVFARIQNRVAQAHAKTVQQ